MDASKKRSLIKTISWLLAVFLCIAAFVGCGYFMFGRSTEDVLRSKCSSNLRQIGRCIDLYCAHNAGEYPDSFQSIVVDQWQQPDIFVCPDSSDTIAGAPTTQAVADELAKSGHDSYIYLGKGLSRKTVEPHQVIAYESLDNHHQGMNVLCGDGHAEFLNAARGHAIIAAAATTRPVMLPP